MAIEPIANDVCLSWSSASTKEASRAFNGSITRLPHRVSLVRPSAARAGCAHGQMLPYLLALLRITR